MTLTSQHIDDSIARALAGESNLDPRILEIRGFATPTMRHLFNNLCAIDDACYFEIGVYCGATFCAAWNPKLYMFACDNFSQVWHENCNPGLEFEQNLAKFVRGSVFIPGDCWNVTPFGRPVDIFYYDGNHTREDQAKALPHFFDQLSETFLFIVDDWCWESAAAGSKDGFDALGSKVSVEKSWELIGDTRQDNAIWHNGIALFLCHKK